MKNIIETIIFCFIFYSASLIAQSNNWMIINTENSGVQKNVFASARCKNGVLYFLCSNNQAIKYDGLWKNFNLKIPGVPFISIKKIVSDDYNNLWFITNGYGLIKFNNSEYIVYNNTNSGLLDNNVNDISFDKSGNLWIATNDMGLFKYDGLEWIRYWTGNSNIPDNQITTISIDKFNRKWIGTKLPSQVAVFNDTLWIVFNRANSGIGGQINKIIFDSLNNTWIGTALGISKYNGYSWDHYYYTQGKEIRDILIDNENRIWFAGDMIVCYDNGNWFSSEDLFPFGKINQSIVNNILLHSDTIFFSTRNLGIIKLYDSSYFEINNSNTGIQENYIKTVSVDRDNNYWIGTYGSGISKLTAIRDTLIWESHIPNTIVYSISFDSSGRVWAGTMYEGLFRYDGVKWDTFTTQNSILPSNIIVTVKVDKNNVKWIGTNRGLVKIEGEQWMVYNTQNSPLPGNTIGSIVVDGENNKWFGTENGVVKYDGTNWVIYNTTNSPLPDNIILSLELDKSGNLWIGTWNGGLAKFDGNNWIIFNKDNSPLPSNRIRSLRVDKNNVIWIGTEINGLVRYDGQSWQIFDIYNSPLPNNFINGLAVDRFNHKLIATSEGLAIYREEGVVVEVEDKPEIEPERFVLYQNYPNPFNSHTKIRYTIPEGGRVSLRVYNIIGEEVAVLVDRYMAKGEYEVEFNASKLPSGIYVYRLSCEKFSQVKKMILIK